MSWAAGLGKGRRHATDGAAWTAAISAAACGFEPQPMDIATILPAIHGEDLTWPLSYAIRLAYESREHPETARQWGDLARTVALRCRPGELPGRIAERYGLATSWEGSAGGAAWEAPCNG